MTLRGLLPLAAVTATVIGAGIALFDVVHLSDFKRDKTFSLAPVSLGNPAAAATLQTRRVDQFSEDASKKTLESIESVIPVLPAPVFKTVAVKSGSTLSGVLTTAGLSNIEAASVVEAFSDAFNPRKIRAGHKIKLSFMPMDTGEAGQDSEAMQFIGLNYEPTALDLVTLERTDTGFAATKVQKELNLELRHADGTIDDSLYMAGVRAGLPVPILIELIHAYSWDVDFQRDIRKGDSFNVLYQSKQDSEDNTVAYGDVLYAEINLSGTALPIYRYTTTDGTTDYFDDKGRSAKKTLMRTPIDGARLSSGFGTRKHPILGYNKMHKGLDFAAPRGTPIYAAGDGVIDYAGRNGAYGKYVRIRHNGEFSTAYAHMKGFGSGISKGKRVRQGQVIGYVGTTGRSTGPHLHYEILKNKKQVNPMKVKMPSGLKLKGEELARFQDVSRMIEDQYAELVGQRIVAQTP